MTIPDPEDYKARFKEALEKKTSKTSSVGKKRDTEESSKMYSSLGNKPKMFRRKSGQGK